jgi:dipeptidyl aminopeptidase/acylaminoacyl peptidase
LAANENSNAPEQENAGKRKIQIDDVYRYRLTLDPQTSPDGRTVAYVQTRLRKKKNDYASNIWLVDAAKQGSPRKFTTADKRDMYPRWSPSGEELAFISTRTGKPQVWVIPTGGGEARQVTRAKRGVGQFCWSPDGRWIAYTTQVDNEQDKQRAAEAKAKSGAGRGEDDGDSENRMPGEVVGTDMPLPAVPPGEWDEDQDDEKDDEDKGDHAYVITRVHIKAEGQGLLLRRTHAFLVPASGGKERQITEGDWDAGSLRWSPDGRHLAFLSDQEPDEGLNNISDIFVLPIGADGTTGELRRVTNHDSVVMTLDWLPGSDGFAVLAHSRTNEGAFGTNAQVWTISLEGRIVKLTESWDRTAGMVINSDLWAGTGEPRVHFSADGGTAYFIGSTEGTAHIFSVPVAGGEVRQVTHGRRAILNFDLLEDGFVYAATSPDHPVDLYRCDPDGGNERKLTDVQADVLSQLEVAPVRELWIDRPDGTRVQGWLMLPPDFDEGRKYPLVLQIHGGPHVAYGESFFHEFQVLAARGYIVLYTNPRGSQGYGQAFSDAILNDWGGVDYDDLMAFVDHVEALPYVDGDRMAVAGGSYGGYMTAWMIGHTNRFKSAVAMRPVTNLYSAWGSGDFTHLLWSWEFEGMPQDRTALYLERSPVTYVKNIETPLLLTHAEDDYRVDIEQSAELYIALKVLGKTVKMVRFPSGGHDVSRSGKPSLRVERLEHIADWIDLYTRGERAQED